MTESRKQTDVILRCSTLHSDPWKSLKNTSRLRDSAAQLMTCLFSEKMDSAESMAATMSASDKQFRLAAAISIRARHGSRGRRAISLPKGVTCPSPLMASRMNSCLRASSRASGCRQL